MPRTTFDAVTDGWVLRSPADDCTNGGAFNGFQWVRPSEQGVAVLFDVNGFAGGIQSLVCIDHIKHWFIWKNNRICLNAESNIYIRNIYLQVPQSDLLVEGSTFEFNHVPMYQNQTHDGIEYFAITAYFTDPSKIQT